MVDSELRIPREHFVSGERAQEELALFRELPLAAAHLSELPNPGDFVTREVGGVSVIITHGDDGVIRSYRNMCAHRGGRVEQKPAGRKRIFMCQYHGWSFDAKDGGLRKLSYEDTFGPIDYSCTGLTPIHTEVRYGLIFLTFDGDAAKPLDSYFGPDPNRRSFSTRHFRFPSIGSWSSMARWTAFMPSICIPDRAMSAPAPSPMSRFSESSVSTAAFLPRATG
jgi:phenylpropionate dioxygenase-like ring-hydroxylating dioxygenase large terminal subunit